MIEHYLYQCVEILSDIAEVTGILVFVGIYLDKDVIAEKWRWIAFLGVLMGMVCYLMDRMSLLSLCKSAVLLVVYVVILGGIYGRSIRRTVYGMISYLAIFLPFELFVTLGMKYLLGKRMEQFFCWSDERMFTLVLIRILELLLVFASYHWYNKNKKIQVSRPLGTLVFVMNLAVIAMMLLFFIHFQTGKYMVLVSLSYVGLAICLEGLLLYTMIVVTANIERAKELEFVQLHREMLQRSLEENKNSYLHWEKELHDYKNTMICLEEMLSTGKVEDKKQKEVRDYIQQEIREMQRNRHLVKIGNPIADSILSFKWVEAEKRGIFFSIQGRIESNLPVKDIHLGQLLGNLLDNAIDGTREASGRRYVEIIFQQNPQVFSIHITNSATVEKIDFSRTSKRNMRRHGIGLRSVREMVEEYGGSFFIAQRGESVEMGVRIPMREGDMQNAHEF